MITAQEARDMNPAVKLDEVLKRLDALIRSAAQLGHTGIRTPYDLTVSKGGYDIALGVAGLEDALVAAGYKVTARFEHRQFVDAWVEISWKEAA